MTKRPNPYTTLANDAREWARSVLMARARTMWRYPKERLNEGWPLSDLRERTAAADQLGYDVRLRATDDGLVVEYVKRPPPPPWAIRP